MVTLSADRPQFTFPTRHEGLAPFRNPPGGGGGPWAQQGAPSPGFPGNSEVLQLLVIRAWFCCSLWSPPSGGGKEFHCLLGGGEKGLIPPGGLGDMPFPKPVVNVTLQDGEYGEGSHGHHGAGRSPRSSVVTARSTEFLQLFYFQGEGKI